ncbi:MAG: alkaline phosphatase family protein, partial [Chitinophagaceae bacterium]
QWVQAFNDRKIVDSLLMLNWQTLYPISTYTKSDADDKNYEGKFSFEEKPVFPHMTSTQAGKNYSIISSTPYGNYMSLQFAEKALKEEKMGTNDVTDFLTVSLSSPDYIGHQFGPNSIEVEDNYLRLDRDLASFFAFLDKQYGKDYTVFLTADHGVAQVPGFTSEHHLPGGLFNSYSNDAIRSIGKGLGIENLISNVSNNQIYINLKAIDSAKLDARKIKSEIIKVLHQFPEVYFAFDNSDLSSVALPFEVKEKFIKGYHPKLSGDIQVILKSNYFSGAKTGTTHGSWYPYDSHIPCVFMGWGVKPGKLFRETYMSDIAPTISALLKIQMPSGSIGKPIFEMMK